MGATKTEDCYFIRSIDCYWSGIIASDRSQETYLLSLPLFNDKSCNGLVGLKFLILNKQKTCYYFMIEREEKLV